MAHAHTENGYVFVSHAHADNALCQPLLHALDEWGVRYWFDTQAMFAGDDLADSIQQAITDSAIFLRVCTAALQESYWCKLELSAFRGLAADDQFHHRGDRRVLINLILDSGYKPEPFDLGALYVDGAGKKSDIWLAELHRALDQHGAIPAPSPPAHAVPPPPASAPAVTPTPHVDMPATATPAAISSSVPAHVISPVIDGSINTSIDIQRAPARGSRAKQRRHARVGVSVAAMLVVLSFAVLASMTHGAGLFGARSAATRTPAAQSSPTYAPWPTSTPVPNITYKSSKLRYSVTVPKTLRPPFTDYQEGSQFAWEEGISPSQSGGYLHGSLIATFSISEDWEDVGRSAYAIVNNYVTQYVSGDSHITHSAIIALPKTNGSCMSATIDNPEAPAQWPQVVIGCSYAGRRYLITFVDDRIDFADDQKTFFTPLLDSLNFY